MVVLVVRERGAFCLCAHWLVRGKPWLAVGVIAWEEVGNKVGKTNTEVGNASEGEGIERLRHI